MIAVTTLFAVLFAYPVLSSVELFRRQLDLSAVPACGQTCLINAATNPAIVGSCSLTDVACLCKDDALQSSVQSCALSSCSTAEQGKLLTFATKMCPEAASTSKASSAPAPSLPSGVGGEIAGLPACGQNCLVDTASNGAIAGGCSVSDVGCFCKNSNFLGAVTTCVASKCSLNEKLTMLNWSTTTCPAGGADSTKSTPAIAAPTAAATSTADASAPTQTSVPDSNSYTSSYSPATTNKTDSAPGNSTSVVTVTYTSASSSKATSVATPPKTGESVPANNSSESTSPATVLTGPGCLIMASVFIPALFL